MDKFKRGKDSTSQPGVNDVNKIIKLQTQATRRMQMKLDISERKAALTASILSVVALVTFLNQKVVSHFETKSTSSRTIASVDGNSEYGFQWQKELALKLSHKSKRSIASYGEAPSKLDQIRFGLLEGKYSLRFEGDGISEIQFLDSQNNDRPKYIDNYNSFLLDNKDVLMPRLSSLKVIDSKSDDTKKEQVIEALDNSQNIIGRFSVVTDKYNRFLSMKFTKTN